MAQATQYHFAQLISGCISTYPQCSSRERVVNQRSTASPHSRTPQRGQSSEDCPMKNAFVYLDTGKEVGDVDRSKVFANIDAAQNGLPKAIRRAWRLTIS